MTRRQQDIIHKRWYKLLPRFDKADQKHYEDGKQCLVCKHYVPLEGPLGADWGACTNKKASSDMFAVFEHFTCRHWQPAPDKD